DLQIRHLLQGHRCPLPYNFFLHRFGCPGYLSDGGIFLWCLREPEEVQLNPSISQKSGRRVHLYNKPEQIHLLYDAPDRSLSDLTYKSVISYKDTDALSRIISSCTGLAVQVT